MVRIAGQAGAGAPFVWVGSTSRRNVLWTLGGVTLLATLYAILYRWQFLPLFFGYMAMGMVLEFAMLWLASGRLQLPSGSAAVTAALLACSVPPSMPVGAMAAALAFAIVVVRGPTTSSTIRVNRMLVARLFLMFAFNAEIVAWPALGGAAADAIATATPLELFHTEEALYPVASLLRGSVRGEWESLYRLVPGGPGEVFTPVIVVLWVLLAGLHVLEWRVGVGFLLAFGATLGVVGQPVLFNLLSGSVVFSAVFIAGDPVSTPRSRMGRWVGGALAGVINALIRTYTFYSEGIVFSFLALNMLSPALDRMMFALRGRGLAARLRRFERIPQPLPPGGGQGVKA